ncbi:membrane protein [Aquipluma nitroreducens]|uniref:Membrane protein n=1 Tax=Aquipluma nitroreducens TaxID=2010828 RepID=A0A5K7S400_9BACT|nr:O-antigen ligase family protein [Aquipluma nitroreducens]BBE16227.1 membrane protein [Aquipluma nitroreducens]
MYFNQNKNSFISNVTGIIIVCISFIPLYNRYLTHQRVNRYDLNFTTLLIEYLLVIILVIIFFSRKPFKTESIFEKRISWLSKILVLYVSLSFVSCLFSKDVSRSLSLFAFGMIGPLFLYLIIVYRTSANFFNLNLLIRSFWISNILFLIIAYLFAFRYGFSSDLLEVRSGKNIYGSNSVIGSICFLLPIIFVKNQYLPKLKSANVILSLFGIISIIWVIISLSRWGYATLFITYFLISILINKSLSIKKIVIALILFILIMILVPRLNDLIIHRFTGNTSNISMESVYDNTSKEGRFVRWANAYSIMDNNLLLGIGLGNNYLVDPFKSPDAHNLFINLLLEQGLLIFLSFIAIFVALYKLVKSISKHYCNNKLKYLAISLGIGIFVFHFWSLTGGSHIQAAGIISAVKNYYFFISMGLLVYISRLLGKLNKIQESKTIEISGHQLTGFQITHHQKI